MFDLEEYLREFFKVESPTAKELWAFQYEEMSIHTQGKKPERLIEKRRPYEDEDIKKYRIDAYEPITKAPVIRAIDQITRTFNNANVVIKMGYDLRTYTEENIFDKVSFLSYINKNVTRRMIEDPNGILLWWVKSKDFTKLNERVEVEPRLVLSKNIKHFSEDYFSFLSNEKSFVRVWKGNKWVEEKSGEVYYIVTKNEYIKKYQVGEKSKKKFEDIIFYNHKLEYLPLVILKGYETIEPNEKTNDDIHYYTSFFSGFIAYANECIRQFSDHQGIMTVSGFPLREMESMTCPGLNCKGGKVFDENDRRTKKICSVCNGKGEIVPSSPYGVLLRPTRNSLSDSISEKPMLSYISPDTAILEYSGKYWKELLSEAEKALNLLFIDEAQSGVAKDIDREVLLSTLDAIGLNIFQNIVKNSLIIIRDLRQYKQDSIIIETPPSFKVKTEKEISEEITSYVEKGAPDIVLIETTRQWLHKKFGRDKNLVRMIDLLFLIDTNFHYPVTTKQLLLASGAITDEAFQKSQNVLNVSMRIFKKYGDDITNISDEQLMKEIEKELSVVIKDLIPKKPEPVVDPNGLPVA